MKTCLAVMFLMLVTSQVFGKIVHSKDEFHIEAQGKKNPIMLLNTLIKKGEVSEVKLFEKGRVPLLQFAKGKEKAKLYTVDSKGFIYSLKPFESYNVKRVDSKGYVSFKEVPNKKFGINSKGIFYQ